MEFLKKITADPMKALKMALIALATIVVIALVLPILQGGFSVRESGFSYTNAPGSLPSLPSKRGMVAQEMGYRDDAYVTSPMPPIDGGYTSGDRSEEFEVKEYSASIETEDLDRDCGVIQALKSRTDVIFEYANTYERGCSFTFKVKKESTDEILAVIESMDPRDLSKNTYTIVREVEQYESEVDILKRKLDTLDSTLTSAIASYESITDTATRIGDAETLAKIIESKLGIIERLTQARIDTLTQLDYIEKAKADSLDHLAYANFSVSIYENKFADGGVLKDSWKAGVQNFVRESNALVQDLSLGLVSLLLLILKYFIYFFIILFVVRFSWNTVKSVWGNNFGKKSDGGASPRV